MDRRSPNIAPREMNYREQWDDHLNGDADGLGLMRGIIAGLAILAVILMTSFLVCWAVEIARSAIMTSGTVAQVTAPDFDLERTLVEAHHDQDQ